MVFNCSVKDLLSLFKAIIVWGRLTFLKKGHLNWNTIVWLSGVRMHRHSGTPAKLFLITLVHDGVVKKNYSRRYYLKKCYGALSLKVLAENNNRLGERVLSFKGFKNAECLLWRGVMLANPSHEWDWDINVNGNNGSSRTRFDPNFPPVVIFRFKK